jgi:hypothetical protein
VVHHINVIDAEWSGAADLSCGMSITIIVAAVKHIRNAILLVGVVGLCLLGIVVVLASRRQAIRPVISGALPDRDIVFSVAPGTLGFIQADGSGYATRTVTSGSWLPFERFPTYVSGVTWGQNGQGLVGRYPLGQPIVAGIPFTISEAGTVSVCPPSNSWPVGTDRVWGLPNGELLTSSHYPGRPDEVVTVDMITCQPVKTLYQSPMWNVSVVEAAQSSQGWLAVFGDVPRGDLSVDQVLILSPDGTRYTIDGAAYPAWSPDGNWLAYSADDGLYIADPTGSQRSSIRLGLHPYVRPSWSPDGQWLVYDQPYAGQSAIFKVDLDTQTEVLLHVGGYLPDWRWRDIP